MRTVQTNQTSRSLRTAKRRRDRQPAATRRRALALLELEIDFIPNAEFRRVNADCDELVEATLSAADQPSNSPAGLPAHLRRLCEQDVLTHEQEAALFREMNFAKYRADKLRSELDLDDVDPQAVATIESLISRAQTIRDHIIKANMRLVISIAKKFVSPQHSFDDILSEGTLTLMQTVEKFDYDRGFRFSTYAYRSIVRSVYRSISLAKKEEARFVRDTEDWAIEAEENQSSDLDEQVWGNLRELTAGMLDQLDRRERFIIRSRYALGAHRKVRTFQYLGDRLGISKERARQLEKRAVAKLREMAGEFEMDELFGAAMV